jgi:mxaA protein
MSRRRSSVVSSLLAGIACWLATHAMAQGSGANEAQAAANRPNATVQQPRAYGYVVGDLFTQRVLLSLNGREFEPAELPSTGRVGVWFERRAVGIEEDVSGRRWLRVDYQLMNSPQALRVVTLPAWRLKPAGGASNDQGTGESQTGAPQAGEPRAGEQQTGERPAGQQQPRELRIGSWPITVAPLTPERPDARPGLGSLQPDRIAPLIALAPIERGLSVGLAGFLLTALAWIAWFAWRNWRASAAQPFAHALVEMRGVDSTAPEAWHALHRAFDATAGRAVRTDTLPELFRRAPHLVPLRAQIEEFFRQSAARFFAGASVGGTLSPEALCRELRRIEKRNER